MANLFVPDQYNLWIHLLTAVVRQSWNHRGLGDRGKAGLTVTHLLPQIPLWNNSCCSRAVGERAGGCSRIGRRHNNRFAIVSDPLSYLYTSASPGKLIALHCRKAPVSKQPNSWRAKKCQMAKKKAECGLNLHHTYTKAEPVIALNVYHTCGNHFWGGAIMKKLSNHRLEQSGSFAREKRIECLKDPWQLFLWWCLLAIW